MKKILLFLSLFIIVTMACDISVNVASPTSQAPFPTNTTLPDSPTVASPTLAPTQVLSSPTPIPATATTVPPTISSDIPVVSSPVSLVLPSGLASGISLNQIPRADGSDLPYWELTPGHTVVSLEGYLLQGKSHQPQIYVYPATDYALLVPGAFESMHRLRNVMNEPIASVKAEELPAVPFFNAAQTFAANIKSISFKNGAGVSFLAEYAQYPASVNNQDLFYQFQGFTNDGEYYVIAIFPIMNPMLAETSDAGAILPTGGIPYPYMANSNADMPAYYNAVTNLLNTAAPNMFTPSIDQLDMLIQSMQVNQ